MIENQSFLIFIISFCLSELSNLKREYIEEYLVMFFI